ncbi:MAG: cell division protein SepF [Methanobacteriaceae archaeon]|jgi:SepF-like predicted cell division protein (DUF552 family)|nr:cell division protein SepF [Candidatus Methanorudis spinitermitis]
MNFKDNVKASLGFSKKEKKSINSKDFLNEILDGDVIEPMQPFYEIILIRPESMDGMDYVSDEIIEENNPVIVDLGYFEEEGIDTFEMAIEKIKILKQEYGAESILLCNAPDKNIILIAPSRIKITKKE